MRSLVVLSALLASAPSAAPVAGKLAVTAAWTRATPPGAPNGAGYLTITGGAAPDRLLSVTSPAAPRTELHRMSMADGKMIMRALPDGIAIDAGEAVKLAPGGLHLMFLGIERPFQPGQVVPVTLVFEKAGAVQVELRVLPLGASGP